MPPPVGIITHLNTRCQYMSIVIYVLLGVSALLSVIVIIRNT